MRTLLQRVSTAEVRVDGNRVGSIDRGLLALVGIQADDSQGDIDWLVSKIARLRVFDDEAGVMNRSVRDIGGEVLAVSQFTLYASTRKGNRPSYSGAAPTAMAEPLFREFVESLSAELQKPVPTGVFGARMEIALINSGPVTIWLDSKARE